MHNSTLLLLIICDLNPPCPLKGCVCFATGSGRKGICKFELIIKYDKKFKQC